MHPNRLYTSFSARTWSLWSSFHNVGWTMPHEVSSLPVSTPESTTALKDRPSIRELYTAVGVKSRMSALRVSRPQTAFSNTSR